MNVEIYSTGNITSTKRINLRNLTRHKTYNLFPEVKPAEAFVRITENSPGKKLILKMKSFSIFSPGYHTAK